MKTEFQLSKIDSPDRVANGQIVRTLRNRKAMSLRRLAFELDISPPFLSDLELGNRSFSLEMFNRAKSEIAKFNRKK